MSFTQLKTDIKEWAMQQGGGIDSLLPTIIQAGQEELEKILVSKKLNHSAMVSTAPACTITATTGYSFYAPPDFLQFLHLNLITAGGVKYEVTEAAGLVGYNLPPATAALPTVFIRVNDIFYLNKKADVTYTTELIYLKKQVLLADAAVAVTASTASSYGTTGTAPTNWWDTNEYIALLFCCLVELIPWLQDKSRTESWQAIRDAKIASIIEREIPKTRRY